MLQIHVAIPEAMLHNQSMETNTATTKYTKIEMKSIAPYTRPGLLESIATANALALSSNNTPEYLHWESRETELRGKAGHITPSENEVIAKLSSQKLEVYSGECSQ